MCQARRPPPRPPSDPPTASVTQRAASTHSIRGPAPQTLREARAAPETGSSRAAFTPQRGLGPRAAPPRRHRARAARAPEGLLRPRSDPEAAAAAGGRKRAPRTGGRTDRSTAARTMAGTALKRLMAEYKRECGAQRGRAGSAEAAEPRVGPDAAPGSRRAPSSGPGSPGARAAWRGAAGRGAPAEPQASRAPLEGVRARRREPGG